MKINFRLKKKAEKNRRQWNGMENVENVENVQHKPAKENSVCCVVGADDIKIVYRVLRVCGVADVSSVYNCNQ